MSGTGSEPFHDEPLTLEGLPRSCLQALLDHLGRIEDPRSPCQVAYPLREFCFWWCLAGPARPRRKTTRRSHDRAEGRPPLHLVSGFSTTARLVLGQEAAPDKAGEPTAIPVLLERLGRDGGLEGALVTVDAIATNQAIAQAVVAEGADDLLGSRPTRRTYAAKSSARSCRAAGATR